MCNNLKTERRLNMKESDSGDVVRMCYVVPEFRLVRTAGLRADDMLVLSGGAGAFGGYDRGGWSAEDLWLGGGVDAFGGYDEGGW